MKTLSLITFLLGAIPGLAAGHKFPSPSSIKSPDGKWVLTCKSPANSQPGGNHSLMLTKVGGRPFELRQFDRGCSALWSPDSSHIAVTDWLASDMSDVFIYNVSDPGSGRSVTKLFPRKAIPMEERSGHCYFEASKWLDGHRLQIRVSGIEAPANNFEYHYIFNLESGTFQKAKKRPQ